MLEYHVGVEWLADEEGARQHQPERVLIEWEVDGEFALSWSESGGPTVAPQTRTGFGSRMIERALAATLKGKATVDYRTAGIRFELRATPDALSIAEISDERTSDS